MRYVYKKAVQLFVFPFFFCHTFWVRRKHTVSVHLHNIVLCGLITLPIITAITINGRIVFYYLKKYQMKGLDSKFDKGNVCHQVDGLKA